MLEYNSKCKFHNKIYCFSGINKKREDNTNLYEGVFSLKAKDTDDKVKLI